MIEAAVDLKKSSSPSTDRALDLLEALSSAGDGLSLSELVRETGLPQNSVYRIVGALHERGYVHRRESDRKYSLSNRFFDLGRPQVEGKSLAVCSLEALRELCEETGETTQILVRSGNKGVVLEQITGRHAVKVTGRVGMTVPLYSCAPGKAILACLPEEDFDRWLGGVELKQFTATTRATSTALRADLAATHARGYAVDLAEGLEGIHCVAAAVLDRTAYPIAAVTVMAPAFRLPEHEFSGMGERCIAAAQRIRTRLLS